MMKNHTKMVAREKFIGFVSNTVFALCAFSYFAFEWLNEASDDI